MAKSAKSSLAITREQFRTQAKPIAVVINGKDMIAAAKEFSTGSLGWNINDKLQLDVGGQQVMVQVGLNLTIIGSKDLPQDPPGSGAPAQPVPGAGRAPTASGEADF
jgi:hypothetical protein